METTTQGFAVLFPDWFDERAAFEAQSKGYLPEVEVQIKDGPRVRLFFIEPTRLQQDLEEQTKWGKPYFTEPNMVVIPEVTEQAIRAAIAALAEDDLLNHFEPVE